MSKEKKIKVEINTPEESVVDYDYTPYGTIKIKEDISIDEKEHFVDMVCSLSTSDGKYNPVWEDVSFKGLYVVYFVTNVELPRYDEQKEDSYFDIDACHKIFDELFGSDEKNFPHSYHQMKYLANKKIEHELSVIEHKAVMDDFVSTMKAASSVLDARISTLTDYIDQMDNVDEEGATTPSE